MDTAVREHAQFETDPLRDVVPVELATDGIGHLTSARQLEDDSGSGSHHTGQLSQNIVRCFGKEPVAIIQPREHEGSDESMACITGERSTDRSKLTYLEVQRTCQPSHMSRQAQGRIQDDSKVADCIGWKDGCSIDQDRPKRALGQTTS